MSDFTQTMKDWHRMCDSFDGCLECPLGRCPSPRNSRWDMDLSFAEMEEAIDKWAEKHPEPQYPTWGEWFEEQGELTAEWRDIRVVSNVGTGVIGVLYQHIPADIAEKLGIEPKEHFAGADKKEG